MTGAPPFKADSVVEMVRELGLKNPQILKPINIKTTSQYGQNDAFYEAIGSYSIFHTCNTWTNNLLKKASLPASFWLAFDDGILYQYNKKSNP